MTYTSNRKRTITALLLLLLPSNIFAQTDHPAKLSVGDRIVDGSVIKPYKNLWQFTYTKPTGESLTAGTWSDEVEKIEVGGRPLLKRTQVETYTRRNLVITIVNIFDPKTMEPISRDVTRSTGTYEHVKFSGRSVEFERLAKPDGTVERGALALDQKVYDFFGGLYGVLLVTFPLKTGFSASLPSLDEDKYEVRWADFKVMGEEMVGALPGQQVKAWVVKTDDNGPMTFWLTKMAPYVIKLVYVNPSGITATYTMIDPAK